MALDHKEGGTNDLKDYKPISLVTCLYKVIAKIMVSRIRGLMPLLFANDIILFSLCDKESVRNYKRLLKGFEVLSGLKINFRKSVVIRINCETSESKENQHLENLSSKKWRKGLVGGKADMDLEFALEEVPLGLGGEQIERVASHIGQGGHK
ncbi:hypothetical protein PIB30_034289 [Stylosanthes scabra]|uniref:Reverse transcriptase domain-containing protein n=1 Tax=Stylosanthes scabra TaxID=79078 RepID=A0ABU6Z9Q4_9FABA|nr:hypothetical protein [Stylosanthes scabra]